MLPQGFTRVEWIESTGSQHVNTGIVANQNTRIRGVWNLLDGSTVPYVFGAWTSSMNGMSSVFFANGSWGADYGTERKYFSAETKLNQNVTIDMNKNVCTIGNTMHTFGAQAFTGAYPILLFCFNQSGSPGYYAKTRCLETQIYNNGTIVRDYIPCIDENGDANLWDDVEGALADKEGTFVAGPVDTVPLTLNLITDRTAADVTEAKRLMEKLRAGETLTNEESAAYFAGLRGCYNASDMNRVGAAVRYVANRLNAEGYGAYVEPKTDWQMEDIVRQSDWDKYLDEVRHLRRKLTLMRTTPQITDGMYSGLKSYAEANAIEQILVDLDWMLTNIIRNYIYAGEVFAGEV